MLSGHAKTEAVPGLDPDVAWGGTVVVMTAAATIPEPEPAGRWTVGPAARLAGTTVRTLHHYDALGLVTPRGRTAAGYRTYTAADIDRVRRVLVYRELGFGLERVSELLAAQDTGEPRAAESLLREQLDLLHEQADRLHRRITAVERELEAHDMGTELTQQEKRALFGEFSPDEHAAEAEERWGETDAYQEAARRTGRYTADDWRVIKAEAAQLEQALADLLAAGEPATGPAAVELAERHRAHLDRWFYPTSHQSHRGLGELYVGDERFTAHYEQRAEGLARYLRDAITANAARHDA